MRGAASLFMGPEFGWGGEVPFQGGILECRFRGTGLFAIEAGSGHVYALAWDGSEQDEHPSPGWVRLP